MEDTFKQEMKEFWGQGWEKRRRDDNSTQTKERYLQELGVIRLVLELEEAEQVREMRDIGLQGRSVLEIGCGVGTSSVLFALDGAHVTATDLTEEAVAIAKSKFELMGLDGTFVQADAEQLPFVDDSFDIIFSSGVLHHTPNTEKAVQEIHRVLKPGGDAVVMLYAKWSFHFWVYLWLVRSLLLGERFRYGKSWLGHATELAWHTKVKKLNPMTKVYSGRKMKQLFKDFQIVDVRKHSFHWPDLFPGIYHLWRRHRVRIGDAEVILPSSFERTISRFLGFALVIHSKK